jgi:phosphonate transport system ATP-binding protein
LTVVCSLHQVDLAIGWGDRIIGLRNGNVVLDTPARGISRAQVMEIYSRVTATSDLVAEARADLIVGDGAR